MKMKIDLKSIAMFFVVILLAASAYTFIAQPLMNGEPLFSGLNIGGDDDDDTTDTNNDGKPTPGIFSGPISINFAFLNHADLDSAYTTANGTGKVYHKDGSLLGTMTAAGVVTGNVLPQDNGQLYLQWQPASTVYLDSKVTADNSVYLGAATPKSIEGVLYYYFPLDVSDLVQVSGLTTSIYINMYLYVADVSGLDYTSVTNATSADFSGTSWVTASATGYISGMTQETAFKITKVEVSMPDAANITVFDNSHVKNLQVKLGLGNGNSMTLTHFEHNTGGTYIQYIIPSPYGPISDPTQEYYGVPVVYASTDAATDISFSLSGQFSGFTASSVWEPTLIITTIGPNGATATFSVAVDFTDS